jgi:hypothetical protein
MEEGEERLAVAILGKGLSLVLKPLNAKFLYVKVAKTGSLCDLFFRFI